MFSSLRNALRESASAAEAADDAPSRQRLRRDFIASRLLKFGAMPGRDAPRQARVAGFDVCYRFNRGDLQSIREVLLEDAYRLPFDLPNARIGVDLGANIGLWSTWAHREYHLERLICVEPDPANFAIVRRNIEANHLPAQAIEAAVAGATGTAFFEQRRESNLGQIRASSDRTESGGIEVRQLSMHDVLASLPHGAVVDILKMDIEGAEKSVLGADVSWLQRVRALVIEWHPDRADPAPLIATITRAGFDHLPCNAARQDNLSAFKRIA